MDHAAKTKLKLKNRFNWKLATVLKNSTIGMVRSDFSISATWGRQNVVKILKHVFLKILGLENFKNLSTYVEKCGEISALKMWRVSALLYDPQKGSYYKYTVHICAGLPLIEGLILSKNIHVINS